MEKKYEFTTLEDHLCFSLYACSRAILRLYRPYLDELKLTYPQYLVLVVLWERKEATVKELGQLLDLDSGTLTPMLKRMESSQLIERMRDPADERVVIVRIKEEGLALRDKAQCIPQSLIEATGMSVEEMNAFNQAVRKLSNVVITK
ncbi:MarR family winged helix-turn-helix transcriptional regulator [Robertmurraya massiliosenegalensis]|uniref:MarR family winged helix-turn-helix transcriptional regulator n=1 Tax=Robertmurraya massiliosenegalensis TaxID=1287657 RepID=UPI0002DE71DC|nr:MarR family transcriptional regulator [Robertmurraya massiliosenegalensis]